MPESKSAPKEWSTAEVEALLAAEPAAAQHMSCSDLCNQQADDLDTLSHLGDFPEHSRGIRALAIADLKRVVAQMKAQHCPPCQ